MTDADREADDRRLRAAREHIVAASRPVVLTGAGVSAESGIPTFRGTGGLWRDRDPLALATPQAFAREPALVWEFYSWRRERVRACAPNAAHHALAALEQARPECWLITQNVDGLHRAAGSQRLIELHGNLMIDRCQRCRHERAAVPEDEGAQGPPRCDRCGGSLRPGVVWFGEPVEQIERAFELAAQADLVLVVGTSGVVEPAASVARVARQAGASVIEINPDESLLTAIADVSIRGAAAQVLPRLLAGLT